MEGGTPNLCTPKQALHFGESDNEIARAFCSQNPAIRLNAHFFLSGPAEHIGSTGASLETQNQNYIQHDQL